VLLERRPPVGIWAGLWSLPVLNDNEDPAAWRARVLGVSAKFIGELPPIRHGFSHFELEIRPVEFLLAGSSRKIREADTWLWHTGNQPLGLPAPIRRLLNSLDVA